MFDTLTAKLQEAFASLRSKGRLTEQDVKEGLRSIRVALLEADVSLEVVKAFEAASGRAIPYEIMPRRSGDIAACYADPAYAEKVLGWQATRGLAEMCRDTWNWQSKNPNGYR